MSKRYFIFGKTALIYYGAVGVCCSSYLNSAAQEIQPDTSKAVLKIRKKYTEADYFPRIHDKFDGKITRSELMDPRGVYTVAPLNIVSFELHSFDRENEIVMKSNSCFLTPAMKKHIKQLPDGAPLYFRNIIAYDEKDNKYILNGLRYFISKEE